MDMFVCQNGNKVGITRKCDHYDDCGDGSDEDTELAGCIG